MSIAVLSQVFTEARRLMIAGSVVAHGDFRLKKLLPALEQAGKQAPVFAKVAEVTWAVVDGPEDSAANSLLELTSLVNAVLYTQGETGLAGKLEPIETTEMGSSVTQTSARVMKPLLEALSSTGSGRLELIRDAYNQGRFRDLRLVKPALHALDDPYSEIAELIATKVLPLYGKAVFAEVRRTYDQKGANGHARRLKLMHGIDPTGTRELVKAALDNGSKEVKVAAISCLGADPEDLAFLIEQASAKAADVRSAALEALAKVDHADAVAVLEKALTGKSAVQAADAIDNSKNAKLTPLLVAEIRRTVNTLSTIKEKKKISEAVERVNHFLRSFPTSDHPDQDTLLLDLFTQRREFDKLKGEFLSGTDLCEQVISVMEHGSRVMREKLVSSHAELLPEELGAAFGAGRYCLTPVQLYDTFSLYFTAKVDAKKKLKDPAYAKREALIEAITEHHNEYYWLYQEIDDTTDIDALLDEDEDQPVESQKPQPYDPRWLDLALSIPNDNMVQVFARLDHAPTLAHVKAAFDRALKTAKDPTDVRTELMVLLRLKHPDATDAFFAALNKKGNKRTTYYYYWFSQIVHRLPKEAIPRLEEYAGTLPKNEADHWLEAIEELRRQK